MAFIFTKTEFILKKIIIKMISEKFSTNTESFNEFKRGRRIDLVTSGGMTQYSFSQWLPFLISCWHFNVRFKVMVEQFHQLVMLPQLYI